MNNIGYVNIGYVKLVHIPDRHHELYGKTGEIFEVRWENEEKKSFTMEGYPSMVWVMVTSQNVRWFEEVATPISCL